VLAALIIVFREVFEAGLIVGIVMAVTAGVRGRALWISGGVGAGVLGACVVALFTGGLSQLFGGVGQEIFNAGILGFAVLLLGSLVCLLTYLGLLSIPSRYLFGVTSALIAFLAAGMAAQAIAFLEQANIVTALDQTVWNTSWILKDSSFLGRALHTLIGYVDQPTAMQVVVYALTLAVIAILMKLFATPQAERPRAA
jgi:high-affinity iron transporter